MWLSVSMSSATSIEKMTEIENIEKAALIAERAVGEALEYLDSRFGTLLEKNIAEVGHDVTTDADVAAEGIIRELLMKEFPDFSIYGEELENYTNGSEYAWHIDPLDGTNNFAYAIPLYGSCIALTKNDVPLLGVIGQGQVKTIHTGIVSQRVHTPTVTPITDMSKTTLGFSIGYLHGEEKQRAVAFREYAVRNSGRTLSTWAPTVDWASFAKGGIQAMIVHNDYGPEIAAGVACAQSAGASVKTFDGKDFAKLDVDPDTKELCPTSLVAAHPDSIDELLAFVQSFND